jgi:hypothetical protein
MAREYFYDKRNPANKRFVAVDGEGGNITDPNTLFGTSHEYLLLRAGAVTIENDTGLSFHECADFLCNLSPHNLYVAYFFDYDVTMMIKGLPQERAERLFNRALRQREVTQFPLPVQYQGYEFDYLPHKEFKIRRIGSKHWLIISDVGQFFQTSFIKTLEKWEIGTPEERAMIAKGKSMRADFHGIDDEIRAYNAVECLYLEMLMEEFRQTCLDVGYVPKKWQGPGYLASAMLDKHGIPKRKDIPIMMNEEFRKLANAAYYGGRFETTAAGPVAGPIYQYDINSAYPSVLRELPCLIHGSWVAVDVRPDKRQVWFGDVRFGHTSPAYLFHLPVRDKFGNITFPKEAQGVYWSWEVEAAEKAGTTIDFESGWLYENHCDCRPFDWIDNYYAKRIALGKSSKGYVLKLAGNSIYGKTAQSIGYAPYANPIWAGLITAGCRAKIIEAYSQDPMNCYMIATDGIFVGAPLDLPVSNKLGEWEMTKHDGGIFIVQPGIYYVSGGDVKTRGVERGRINKRRVDFEEAWQRFLSSGGEDHTVSIPVDNFITGKQALARNKWGISGHWESDIRQISFDWSNKRKRSVAFEGLRGELRTLPRDGSADTVSVGYHRVIGGELVSVPIGDVSVLDPGLAESDRISQQPDWVEPLFET